MAGDPAYPVVVDYTGGEKTKRGIIRYFCPVCKTTSSSSKKQVWKKKGFLTLLEQYILDGSTLRVLSRQSGYSIQHLTKQFHAIVETVPPALPIGPHLLSSYEETYLIVDALWFGKRFCFMVYREKRNSILLRYSFLKKERGSLIAKDLRRLQKEGYRFTVAVSDGGTGIRNALASVYPHIPHQLCMAHMHRQAINAIGRYPKDYRVQQLKRLADHLWKIESKEALAWWKDQLHIWIQTNGEFLYERRKDTTGRWWFAHPGAKKAVRILTTAHHHSFVFLNHPLCPKTTNAIEGQFSVVSMKHLVHRGLKRERIQPFLSWFVYLYNKRVLS